MSLQGFMRSRSRYNVVEPVATRSLAIIGREISRDWVRPFYGAIPYIAALQSLDTIDDTYGCDPARSIVAYFLSNATTWRGDTARRVKRELNAMLKVRP